MPEQIKANPTGRTAFDGMSNTDLQIMIAHYEMLVHYYMTKRKEAVEELDQRIWHNEEDFWGMDRREKEDGNFKWNSRPIKDALQKNIMDLITKLETAKEALRWITNCKPIIDCGYFEIMEKARITLEEIENDRQS